MSKLSEALCKMRVFNNHNLLSQFGDPGRDVAIEYHPREPRLRPSGTRVFSPSHQTNPKAAWYDHGMMNFVGNRAESLPLAVAWATERYGITEWAASPFVGKIPRYVLDRAKAAVKEAKKAAST